MYVFDMRINTCLLFFRCLAVGGDEVPGVLTVTESVAIAPAPAVSMLNVVKP